MAGAEDATITRAGAQIAPAFAFCGLFDNRNSVGTVGQLAALTLNAISTTINLSDELSHALGTVGQAGTLRAPSRNGRMFHSTYRFTAITSRYSPFVRVVPLVAVLCSAQMFSMSLARAF